MSGNKSGYEIRQKLLHDAQEVLTQEWFNRVETARYNADNAATKAGKHLEPLPRPTIEEVIALAEKMNAFVSSKESPDPEPAPKVSARALFSSDIGWRAHPDALSRMAQRLGMKDPQEFRDHALLDPKREALPPEERPYRRTGRTTSMLLSALVWAEKHPTHPVYLQGYNRECTDHLVDTVREYAVKLGMNADQFQFAPRVFQDHLCTGEM